MKIKLFQSKRFLNFSSSVPFDSIVVPQGTYEVESRAHPLYSYVTIITLLDTFIGMTEGSVKDDADRKELIIIDEKPKEMTTNQLKEHFDKVINQLENT